MEFAITVPELFLDLMTPGCLAAPGVFLFWGFFDSALERIGDTLRIVLIALFGAAGTLARYGLQGVVQVRTGGTFPMALYS